MTSRREFLQGAALAAVPLVAGLPGAAAAATPPFHAVLVDARHAQARRFGSQLAARGARVRAMPDGDVTALWLDDIGPAWRRAPVAIAGLTRPPVLFCLEQLAWAQGLRVVFHAEHVLCPAGAVQHVVHRCDPTPAAMEAADLALRGPLWPAALADQVAAQGLLPRQAAVGPSWAGLAPPLPSGAELLTSWIIAPA